MSVLEVTHWSHIGQRGARFFYGEFALRLAKIALRIFLIDFHSLTFYQFEIISCACFNVQKACILESELRNGQLIDEHSVKNPKYLIKVPDNKSFAVLPSNALHFAPKD